MKSKLLILWLLLGAVFAPTMAHAQVVTEKSTEIVTISTKQYYMHHVKQGETLYGIAKVYGVTQEEILRLNPEINDLGLQAEMVIGIPVIIQTTETTATTTTETTATTTETTTNQPTETVTVPSETFGEGVEYGDGYIIYTVEESQRTRRLLRHWEVDEDEFRRLNPTVGSRVFAGQKVLIPYAGATAQQQQQQEQQQQVIDTLVVQEEVLEEDSLAVEQPMTGPYVLPKERPDWCFESPENSDRLYHVALLVPLYLDEIDRLEASKEKAEKTKNTRAMKFLQFYEGFMMAADSLTTHYGLRLDLTVIDVHENTASAQAALNTLSNQQVDMIIGPFFSKSFAVVQEYASSNNILIINPMSEREAVIKNAPNVVKLKPSTRAMAEVLSDLIRIKYPKAKVTLVTDNSSVDSTMVNILEQVLDTTVKRDILMSNEEMLDLITRESARRKMGKRVLSTLEVEGQIFSTKALNENPDGEVFFDNEFRHLSFSEADAFKNDLSSARENVLVACGKDIVFSTKILNNINKYAQKFPITLIGLPRWAEFDNLLVPNLLNMNAIYFDDHFVDYNDSVVLKFVDDFRLKYESEPGEYAFEGFDVGWYFLNALQTFGPQPMDCLPYYHIPLLHTRYYFNKNRYEDGLENRYLNVYQYDRLSVELKPILIYQETEDE